MSTPCGFAISGVRSMDAANKRCESQAHIDSQRLNYVNPSKSSGDMI